MPALATVRRTALRSLIPPPRLHLSDWIEANIKLPESVSAIPGRVTLWPYQREIADAISGPEIERVMLDTAPKNGPFILTRPDGTPWHTAKDDKAMGKTWTAHIKAAGLYSTVRADR